MNNKHFIVNCAYVFVIGLVIPLANCSKENAYENFPGPSVVVPPVQGAPAKKDVFLPGDSLELFVKEDGTLNGSYLVRDGGYIVIPRAGRLTVEGSTRGEAELKMKEFLQISQLAQATVIVERIQGRGQVSGILNNPGQNVPKVLVYLTGSVSRSGAHAIPSPPGKSVGVYETLLISGGYSKFAAVNKIEIFRFDQSSGKRKKTVIDLRPVIKGLADDMPISEGDIIYVPEKVFGF